MQFEQGITSVSTTLAQLSLSLFPTGATLSLMYHQYTHISRSTQVRKLHGHAFMAHIGKYMSRQAVTCVFMPETSVGSPFM